MTNEINVRFQQLLNEKNWKLLKEELNCLEPLHIADVFDELSKSDQILLFRLLPRKLAKETFEYLPQDR